MTSAPGADTKEIESIMARQLASMSWTKGGAPDPAAFGADFLTGARLYPSARPVRSQSVADFMARMNGLAATTLSSLHETTRGTWVRMFGNVAMAAVVCENLENAVEITRTVEMMLLVKDDGQWRIVAQAWDQETPAQPIPAEWLYNVSPTVRNP